MFTLPERRRPAGHAGRRRRHHVRDRAERVLRARRRQRTADLALQAAAHARASRGGGANRGAAVAGDRVFMETDNAHLHRAEPLHRRRCCGTAQLADWRKNYAASSAPLPAGNLVISGVSGGEHGANGFVAAHDQETGKEVWRFWTVPKPGEPGSETWQGKDIEHGGAPTWFTGSYDAALDLVYWPTGNPSKEYNGDDRAGRQPLRELHPRARSQDRRAEVALPVHAARSLGLGRDADLGAGRRRLAGPAAQADAARRAATGSSTSSIAPTARCCWRSRSCTNLTWASGIGADGRPIRCRTRSRRAAGHQGVSVAGRRDQLVLAVVQPGDRALLRADLREVQHLHEDATAARGRAARRISADRSGRADDPEAAARPEGDRHPHRRDQVGAAAARAGASRGAARSRPRPGS